MEEKIFLEENRSVDSNNVSNVLDVGLSTSMRHLSNEDVDKTLSLFEQYNKERDTCDKFRLILSVNPVCSNVLFNLKSEIVSKEGSDECQVIYDGTSVAKPVKAINSTDPVTYRQAIADTEYSHKELGGYVYHCGVDIFNNHMLRARDFSHVNKISGSTESYPVFNTIRDYLRDGRGNTVYEYIHHSYEEADVAEPLHLYNYDNIYSMQEAFYERCKEQDGWWGFVNPTNIEIENSSSNTITINRMMADNKPCEFIDLYPDRSLFSFVPKYNKFRKRTEKNWDYCITYPYKSDKDLIDVICGGEQQAIRVRTKTTKNNTFTTRLQCSSFFKHNLKAGDYVSVYYYYPVYSGETVVDKTFQKLEKRVKVVSLGDANGQEKERIFNINYSDIETIVPYLNDYGCFYKKLSNDQECSYYFRIFKKISGGNDLTLKSDVNKSAFGKNIYGDETAQIIFLDDINLEGLVDNLGRPVTDVYLTVVKRNAGREKWYSEKNFSSEDVEFSHCFGKVTSALDFSGIDNEPFDYNIHYLHNLNKFADEANTRYTSDYENYVAIRNTFSAWGETINERPTPKALEYDITVDNDEFYGDVVEYDITTSKETVISNIYHRFNTAQRETFAREYMNIYNDVITSDDYDHANGSGVPFSVATYYVNDVKSVTDSADGTVDGTRLYYGNISPEGYYYNPHKKISLKEFSEDLSSAAGKEINYSECNLRTSDDYYTLEITVPTDYGFYAGDFIAFYDSKTNDVVWGEIVSFSSMKISVRFDLDAFSYLGETVRAENFMPYNALRRYYAFWSTDSVPSYARILPKSRKFVWRKIVLPSEMSDQDPLYNMPFSNGRLYVEDKLTFFLRRQDPDGKYGLSVPIYKKTGPAVVNPMLNFLINGNKKIDFSPIIFMLGNSNTCF